MSDINPELYQMSEMERRALTYQMEFSFDGYKTVRKELFAHLRDPAITIKPDSITFNTACIESLENVIYVKLHINETLKRIAVTPSDADDKNALRWCIERPEKRKSRKITGKPFSEMLYGFMGWETDCRYKVIGFKIKDPHGDPVYIFDLTMYESTMISKNENAENDVAESIVENAKPKPQLSERITSSFGETTEETTRMMKQNNLNGYVSYKRRH